MGRSNMKSGGLSHPTTGRSLKNFLAMALGVLASTCSGAAQAADPVLKFNTQEFAPFSYLVDGTVSGPATEIIRLACTKMKATCSFALLPWKRAQAEVQAGTVNGMYVIGWNKGRAGWVHFSPPLMKTEYGFFTGAGKTLDYRNLKDVAGMTVSVYGPSNTSKSLEALQARMKQEGIDPIKIDMRPDDEAGFRKLVLGRADAVFSNRDVGFALAAKLGAKDKVRYAGKVRELNYYAGFSAAHNDAEALKRFDAALTEVVASGEVKKILDQYNMLPADAKLIPANFNKR
jgi:polar amino acid transport system substrate-binding protein